MRVTSSGRFDTLVVNVEQLFVGDEYLWNLIGRRVYIQRKEGTLVFDNPGHDLRHLCCVFAPFHFSVVFSPHADGINIFGFSYFFQPFPPVSQYRISVGNVVVSAASGVVPLPDIVTHKGLAV